jgi:branched-chain amino acid transport system ATP-binding protein
MSGGRLLVDGLTAGYGRSSVLNDVSLELDRGQVIALLGANGAGKTTLLRCISGLIRPTRGSVSLDGASIVGCAPHTLIRRGIAHVPEGRQPFPHLSVRENLLMGAYSLPAGKAATQVLDLVYHYFPILKERTRQLAGLLSGGEQQMLVIARALMGRPQILLLDEPSLGLSPKLVGTVFSIIRRINEEQQISVLLVEQNANAALQVATYGYLLEHGRASRKFDAAELLASDEVRKSYLGHG